MAMIADIASAIVFLAMLAVIVKSRNSAGILTAFGNVFTGSLRAAENG